VPVLLQAAAAAAVNMNRRRVDVIDAEPLFDARVGCTCVDVCSSRNEQDFEVSDISFSLLP